MSALPKGCCLPSGAGSLGWPAETELLPRDRNAGQLTSEPVSEAGEFKTEGKAEARERFRDGKATTQEAGREQRPRGKGRLDCLEVSGEKGGERGQVQSRRRSAIRDRKGHEDGNTQRQEAASAAVEESEDNWISRGTVSAKRYFGFHLRPKCAAAVMPEQC